MMSASPSEDEMKLLSRGEALLEECNYRIRKLLAFGMSRYLDDDFETVWFAEADGREWGILRWTKR